MTFGMFARAATRISMEKSNGDERRHASKACLKLNSRFRFRSTVVAELEAGLIARASEERIKVQSSARKTHKEHKKCLKSERIVRANLRRRGHIIQKNSQTSYILHKLTQTGLIDTKGE